MDKDGRDDLVVLAARGESDLHPLSKGNFKV